MSETMEDDGVDKRVDDADVTAQIKGKKQVDYVTRKKCTFADKKK